MEKILVIGAGLLGTTIVKCLKSKENYQVIAADIDEALKDSIECEFRQIDITNIDNVEKNVKSVDPDLIILTAAMTNVDACEKDPGMAYKINATGPLHVSRICKMNSIRLSLISTDFVFNGTKGQYEETEIPDPINVYGSTKLEGERKVKDLDIECTIARTSVLYGDYRLRFNFAPWVIDEITKGKKLNIVDDQFSSPTLAYELARVLIELYEKDQFDLFHVAGSERINRLEFAYKIANVFNLDKDLINPVKSSSLNQIARRPTDSSLCVDKVNAVLNKKMMDIYSSLRFMKENGKF